MILKKILLYTLLLLLPTSVMAQLKEDKDSLGMALEYFTSKKYHEALLVFQRLDQKYRLNPRYMAFIGTCYYYEWDYGNAIHYLDGSLPELKNFAPHERSFYYWANGESHFNIKQYDKAIPLYETMLTLCYDNEKSDAYYRLGFCYLFMRKWEQAKNNFQYALTYYEKYRNTPDLHARITQIKNMLKGLEKEH